MKIKKETTPLEHYQNRLNAEKENKKNSDNFSLYFGAQFHDLGDPMLSATFIRSSNSNFNGPKFRLVRIYRRFFLPTHDFLGWFGILWMKQGVLLGPWTPLYPPTKYQLF